MADENREIMLVEAGTAQLIAEAEINQQIATAHKFPRKIKTFLENVETLSTLSEAVAEECSYAIPRDGKVIEGPSARFAEIVASCWGNSRAGARVVATDENFVTAQGVFHDLQTNVAITYEVRRKITGKNGKRFTDDMIVVTGNAASSIALRNAILKGVPSPLWKEQWENARKVAKGEHKDLATRRADAMKAFVAFNLLEPQIFQILGVKGLEDISVDHLLTLRGIYIALKEGDTTPEELLGSQQATPVAPPKPTQNAEPKSPQPGSVVEGSAVSAASAAEPTQPSFDLPSHLVEMDKAFMEIDEVSTLAEQAKQWEDRIPRAMKAQERKIFNAMTSRHRERIEAAQAQQDQAEADSASSNGRTSDFDSDNGGSNPPAETSPPTPTETPPEDQIRSARRMGGMQKRSGHPRNPPEGFAERGLAEAWLAGYDGTATPQ